MDNVFKLFLALVLFSFSNDSYTQSTKAKSCFNELLDRYGYGLDSVSYHTWFDGPNQDTYTALLKMKSMRIVDESPKFILIRNGNSLTIVGDSTVTIPLIVTKSNDSDIGLFNDWKFPCGKYWYEIRWEVMNSDCAIIHVYRYKKTKLYKNSEKVRMRIYSEYLITRSQQ